MQVERRACSELSISEFHERYVMTHTPVVITGCVEGMTRTPWTLDHIREASLPSMHIANMLLLLLWLLML